MRLNRFLAASGLGSRRSCEELILDGRVFINGRVCQNLATDVKDEDYVKVGSKRILPEKPLYILLHKPRGYLCTVSDTHDRKTIFELLPGHWPRLFHVGRLDLDSEGLIILTNDGDLGLHLTHPRYKIEKEYEVLLDRPFDSTTGIPKLLRGVNIEGGRARADSVRQLGPNLIRIVLRQGLKRQIRLMLYKLGYEVKRLIRIRIGPLRLTELRPGEWRPLTPVEVKVLQRQHTQTPPEPAAAETKPGKPKTHPKSKPPATRGDGPSSRPDAAGPRGDRRKPPGKAGNAGRSRKPGISGRRGSGVSAPRAARRP